MIELNKKSECCGCEACTNICPKKCIHMKYDEEGFRYLDIDKKECINCGLCEKICPIKNEPKKECLNELQFYAGYNKDDEALGKSSSGGIFWLLVTKILEQKGVVYGVVQDSTFDIKFKRADNIEDCKKFRGSKYLQANVNNIYNLVKEDLENEKVVLFSGTPCQVAGLYNFLRKDYEKLYTCDVVCHGVPSNKVYEKYIEHVEKENNKKVKNVQWRNKTNGWGPNKVAIIFDDNTSLIKPSRQNMFQNGFLINLYLRPSCYECKYARLPRVGDISLADFWGYDGELVEENENKGLSAIIISSEKGVNLFNSIKHNVRFHSVSKEYLTKRSRHVYTHPVNNKNRAKFFADFDKIKFLKLAKKYEMIPNKCKTIIKRIIKRIIKIK